MKTVTIVVLSVFTLLRKTSHKTGDDETAVCTCETMPKKDVQSANTDRLSRFKCFGYLIKIYRIENFYLWLI